MTDTRWQLSLWNSQELKRGTEASVGIVASYFADYTGFQLKSGPYFNMSNLFTKIYNMLYYTTNLYLQ